MPNDERNHKPKKPRGPGKRLGKGQDHPNSTRNRNIKKAEIDALKAKLVAIEERDRTEAAARDEQGGVVSAERMKRVMAQPPEHDKGPTENRLREWLTKDVRTYTAEMTKLAAGEGYVGALQARIDRLEAENAAFRKKVTSGPDDGAAEAERLIERILAEHNQPGTGAPAL